MSIAQGSLELLDEPLAQQLLSSTLPARLAYTWADGTPRTVPIWFTWTGTDLVMATFPGAPKLSALRSGCRVAVTIDTDHMPYQMLSLRGPLEVERADGVVPEYAAAAVRYFGPDSGAAWVAQLPAGVEMTRLALRPDWVGLIDFATGRLPSMLTG